MDFTYPQSEKLKSRKTIERLFANGKSVSKYPLRLIYLQDETLESTINIGVSVPKKHFKKATARNYMKRCLREGYRHNKSILLHSATKPIACMLLFQSNEELTSAQINEKVKLLFEKFAALSNPQ